MRMGDDDDGFDELNAAASFSEFGSKDGGGIFLLCMQQ